MQVLGTWWGVGVGGDRAVAEGAWKGISISFGSWDFFRWILLGWCTNTNLVSVSVRVRRLLTPGWRRVN